MRKLWKTLWEKEKMLVTSILPFTTVFSNPSKRKIIILTTFIGRLQTLLIWTLILTHQQQTAFENIVGNGEIARNKQFLLFPQCFLCFQIVVSPFVHIFDIISLFAAEFEKLKIGMSCKGLIEWGSVRAWAL